MTHLVIILRIAVFMLLGGPNSMCAHDVPSGTNLRQTRESHTLSLLPVQFFQQEHEQYDTLYQQYALNWNLPSRIDIIYFKVDQT